MAEEKLKILTLDIGTEGAVKNVADLRENIKNLKKAIDESSDFTEAADAAEKLRKNQAMLRDVMYSTKTTADDLVKASSNLIDSTGKVNGSYNDLVHTMADLKSAWRATKNEQERSDLGKQIDKINSKLKELDSSTGNFSRNVGDYTNSIKKAFSDMAKGAAEKTDALRKGMQSLGGGLNGVKDGFEGISKSPAIATIGILVSLAMKLADNLKDNEEVMESIKKAMKALEPVMQFFQGVLDTIIDYVVELIGKVGQWLGSSGFFSKLVDGLVGVGNAILKFVIAPFKGVVAAIKAFQEDGIKAIGKAAKAFGQKMKSGVAFKSNYEAGQAAADAMVSGMESRRKKVSDTAGSIAKDAAKTALADWEKALAEGERKIEGIRKQKEELQGIVDDIGKLLDDMAKEEMDGILAEIDATTQAEAELFDKSNEKALQAMEQRKQLWFTAANTTSAILGSIADMYEADSKNAEKNANGIKALRIASASIDTISGAVGAYMQAVETIPPPYGIITGAMQAATVTAAGLAQIAKISATKVSTTASSKASASAPMASAPPVVVDVPRVRNLATNSDMTQLNKAMDDVKVYVLDSDIQAKSKSKKVKVQESSF